MFDIFLIEFFTVFNLSLLYLVYQLINRYVRDRSIFPTSETLKKSKEKTFKEDIPLTKQFLSPKIPEIDLKIVKPEMKVETSFENTRIGEYKQK